MFWSSPQTQIGLELSPQGYRYVVVESDHSDLVVKDFGEGILPYAWANTISGLEKLVEVIKPLAGLKQISLVWPDHLFQDQPLVVKAISHFNKQGLGINYSESASQSVRRVGHFLTNDTSVGVLYIGDDHSFLLTEKNNSPITVSDFYLGKNQMISNLVNSTGLTNTEANKLLGQFGLSGGLAEAVVTGASGPVFSVLADQVNAVLVQQPTNLLYLAGESSLWSGVNEYFNNRLPTKVEPLPIKEIISKLASAVWSHDLFHRSMLALGVTLKHLVR